MISTMIATNSDDDVDDNKKRGDADSNNPPIHAPSLKGSLQLKRYFSYAPHAYTINVSTQKGNSDPEQFSDPEQVSAHHALTVAIQVMGMGMKWKIEIRLIGRCLGMYTVLMAGRQSCQRNGRC